MTELVERVAVLRDEVLDAAGAGASDSCSELFEAVLSALTLGSESVAGIEVTVQDAVSRRLAWGDPEGQLLVDAEWVFDRLMVAVERGFRDPDDRMAVIEAMTQVAVMVSRAIALHAVARSAKDRASRLREEMAQRQLRDAVEKQLQRLSGRSAVDRGTERPTEIARGAGAQGASAAMSSGVVSGTLDGKTAPSEAGSGGASSPEGSAGPAGKTTSSRRKHR
jgi:hypothetical protein